MVSSFIVSSFLRPHQAPLSMRFSRQEYWNGLPCPSPGDLSNPRIKPESLKSPALAGRFFTTRATWETPDIHKYIFICIVYIYITIWEHIPWYFPKILNRPIGYIWLSKRYLTRVQLIEDFTLFFIHDHTGQLYKWQCWNKLFSHPLKGSRDLIDPDK